MRGPAASGGKLSAGVDPSRSVGASRASIAGSAADPVANLGEEVVGRRVAVGSGRVVGPPGDVVGRSTSRDDSGGAGIGIRRADGSGAGRGPRDASDGAGSRWVLVPTEAGGRAMASGATPGWVVSETRGGVVCVPAVDKTGGVGVALRDGGAGTRGGARSQALHTASE